MAATERTLPLMSRLPDQIREMLSRRLRELAGLGLVGLACVAALALATWSVQDPSLSHATSKPVRNMLGYPGAITADLLMQTFGLGAIMLLLPVAIWGWRLLTHRHFDREALRVAVLDPRHRWRARVSPAACRAPPPGRCRPDSAASPATPCCGCRHH